MQCMCCARWEFSNEYIIVIYVQTLAYILCVMYTLSESPFCKICYQVHAYTFL